MTEPTAPTREITSHKSNGLNDRLHVEAIGAPGPGNGCLLYRIAWVDATGDVVDNMIDFHSGPLSDGVTGGSIEALLAIVEDRLRGFQAGQFPCRENAIALIKVQEALMWLHQRTKDRLARNVEGELKP